jgi:subtilisin family serine protease
MAEEDSMRSLPAFLAAAALLAAVGVQAGVIHESLQARLDLAGQDDFISVIVNMTEQAPIAALNADLKTMSATRQQRHEEVVRALQSVAPSQAPLKAYLDARIEAGTVEGYTSYWISNLLVVSATPAEIATIAARPDVDLVESNFKPVLIEPVGDRQANGELEVGDRPIGVTPGLRAIRADRVWYDLGYTGEGTLIGSLDTGVDGHHPALAARWRGLHAPWQECWLDVLGTNTQFPNDGYGHGTHTTGTMTGVALNDTIGVAWRGEWIAANAINQGVGGAFDNDIIACFQWFVDPDGNPNTVEDVPDVVQNSWGVYEGLGYPDCFNLWWNVIDNCEAASVVTTWSAGNEGSDGLRSPADRATTLYNCFSVGAVDATNYGWPYPIAYFSSRGPTHCTGLPPENMIKPEVSAPGVDVYSSVPGGGYQWSGWSGTSMAGPHVAGTVALMRQVNPDLDVDSIKQILIETARDEGAAGEDNNYGWGFIDAQAAVLATPLGVGTIQGHVRNGSYNNVPIPGARVELLGTEYFFTTDGAGYYEGNVPSGTYTARATKLRFAPQQISVHVIGQQILVQDFSLTDIAGPEISAVTQIGTTSNVSDPVLIEATIIDYSTVAEARLYYRVNDLSWNFVPMTFGAGGYEGSIPPQAANSRVDYYVWAEDGVGFTAVAPFGAPNAFYTYYVTQTFYGYDAEQDGGWQLGAPGDQATGGLWVRADPVGTYYFGVAIQPEDDHTPNPGVACFVTGNANPGDPAEANDVDGGCTTLLSPVFDLGNPDRAFVSYWRWYGEGGNFVDDEFAVDMSNDGGATWTPLERVPDLANSWNRTVVDIEGILPLTDQMRFRFVACDLNLAGLVEAAVDDFALETYTGDPTGLPIDGVFPQPRVRLLQNEPNPFQGGSATTILFSLSSAGQASLRIFDISGRLVATLAEGRLDQGSHSAQWDGRDSRGRLVGSGVYFYRLETSDETVSKRLTILR